MAKIECTIRRKNGTHPKLDNIQYHFEASEGDLRHIATVDNADHIATFLKITESYRLVEGNAPAGKPAEVIDKSYVKPVEKEPILYGMDFEPATVLIGEKEITTKELVLMAFKESGMTEDDWNEQDENDVKALIKAEFDKLQPAAGVGNNDSDPNKKSPSGENSAAADAERAALNERAKKAGIKSPHMFKDAAALLAKVEAAEAKGGK